MKELNISELKKTEFDILCFIDDFCKKNDIKYSLAGGTLLGAIRHKGFIPWDDDIDILMERSQYNKFIDMMIQEKNSKYSIIDYRFCKNYNYLFAKVVDNDTILIEDHNKKVENLGVFVDVFPIDALGKTEQEAKSKFKKVKFKRFLGVASNWRHFYINKNRNIFRQIPRFIFFVLSRFQNVRKDYEWIEKQFMPNSDSLFYGCVCGAYEEKEIMPKQIFESYTVVDFEGKQFYSVKEYDALLKRIYGNYMQLPPENMRVAHHTFKAYLK